MGLWAWDRIVDPSHASGIASRYYSVGGLDVAAAPHVLIGIVLLVLYLLALIGFKKKFTYLFLFLVHALGTLFVLKLSLPFFEGFRLTWMTSWPALMAMWVLWVLRDEDTLLSLQGKWG